MGFGPFNPAEIKNQLKKSSNAPAPAKGTGDTTSKSAEPQTMRPSQVAAKQSPLTSSKKSSRK